MPKTQLVKVYANPFGADLDHEGRTCCAVKHEPKKVGRMWDGHVPFIGVHCIATAKSPEDGEPPPPGTLVHQVVLAGVGDESRVDWDHVWEYETEPTTVPLTPYYRTLLTQHGAHGPALLPADEESYAAVHGVRADYRDARARMHQYATERSATPRLRPTAKMLEAHAEKHAGKSPMPELERDHDAEWKAFVGPAIEAEAEAKAKAEADAKTTPPPPPAVIGPVHTSLQE